MFDPNGPLNSDLCDEIMIEVAKQLKSDQKHLARIKCIAESLGHDRYEVKNNAEYLIMTGLLRGALGGYLHLTRKGTAVVNQLLEDS